METSPDRPTRSAAEEKQLASRAAAIAVAGGRYDGSVSAALRSGDFALATRYYVDRMLAEVVQDGPTLNDYTSCNVL